MTDAEARVAPVDNLVRSVPFELRGKGDAQVVMTGHFAVFNEWTRISSWFEGDFMERIAPGAFADVFARGDAVKVLYDHGYDPSVGNKPLGSVTSLTEDKTGARYEVELFDTSYVRDLLPALRAGELGASFRFRVAEHSWVEAPKPSKSNPSGLPERTIERIDPLYEFGPVTFPAYASATAGVRSGSDPFYDRLLADPVFVARFAQATDAKVAERLILAGMAADGPARHATPAPSRAADGPGDPADEAVHQFTTEAHLRLLQRRLAARR